MLEISGIHPTHGPLPIGGVTSIRNVANSNSPALSVAWWVWPVIKHPDHIKEINRRYLKAANLQSTSGFAG